MQQQGVCFVADSGRVSTQAIGKDIFASAIESLDSDYAQSIRQETQWRKQYVSYLPYLTERSIANRHNAINMARAGLAAAYKHVKFFRDEQLISLEQAMTQAVPNFFYSYELVGEQVKVDPATVPYRGRQLRDQSLEAQLRLWMKQHIIKPSHAHRIRQVIQHEQCRAVDKQLFVLLGAGAEIGPYQTLLALGATVVAVDLNRKETWLKLIKTARHSPGKLIIPLREPLPEGADEEQLAEMAGANLLSETPEIAQWLRQFDQSLVLGQYAYLDGADHVRVVMAMDAIACRLRSAGKQVKLSYLLTPTDVYAVPESMIQVSQQREKAMSWHKPIRALLKRVSANRWFAANISKIVTAESGKHYGIINSLLKQQGPNYALAKRIQRWRAIEATTDGVVVSCNIAPSTATRSVTSNKLFMIGFAGAEEFGLEVFEPATANSLMTLAMLYDLNMNDERFWKLDNPEEMFMEGANHGGMWSSANQLSSILGFGVIIGWLKTRR